MRTTLDADPRAPLGRGDRRHGRSARAEAERIAAERDTTLARLQRQLRGDLENIVAKALRKAPAERYPTVDALRRRPAPLARRSEPVSARPDSLAYRTGALRAPPPRQGRGGASWRWRRSSPAWSAP